MNPLEKLFLLTQLYKENPEKFDPQLEILSKLNKTKKKIFRSIDDRIKALSDTLKLAQCNQYDPEETGVNTAARNIVNDLMSEIESHKTYSPDPTSIAYALQNAEKALYVSKIAGLELLTEAQAITPIIAGLRGYVLQKYELYDRRFDPNSTGFQHVLEAADKELALAQQHGVDVKDADIYATIIAGLRQYIIQKHKLYDGSFDPNSTGFRHVLGAADKELTLAQQHGVDIKEADIYAPIIAGLRGYVLQKYELYDRRFDPNSTGFQHVLEAADKELALAQQHGVDVKDALIYTPLIVGLGQYVLQKYELYDKRFDPRSTGYQHVLEAADKELTLAQQHGVDVKEADIYAPIIAGLREYVKDQYLNSVGRFDPKSTTYTNALNAADKELELEKEHGSDFKETDIYALLVTGLKNFVKYNQDDNHINTLRFEYASTAQREADRLAIQHNMAKLEMPPN